MKDILMIQIQCFDFIKGYTRSFKALSALIISALLLLASAPLSHARGETDILGEYLSARVAENLGDYSKAVFFYKKIFADDAVIDSVSTDILSRAHTLFLIEGEMEWARRLNDKIISEYPKDQTAQLAKIVFLVTDGKPEQARKRLDLFATTGIGAYTTQLFKAWLLAADNKTDLALKTLDSGKQSALGNLFNVHRGLINEMAGRFDKAAGNFRDLGWPNGVLSARISRDLIRVDLKSGNVDEAKAVLKAAKAGQPDSRFFNDIDAMIDGKTKPGPAIQSVKQGIAYALLDVARIIERSQNRSLIRLISQLVLYLNPDLVPGRILLAKLYTAPYATDKAIKLLQGIPADSPYYWQAGLEIAVLEDRKGDLDKAEARLTKMISENPHWISPALLLGNIMRIRKQDEKAIKAYDAALRRIGTPDKRFWRTLYSRGISLERSGQWKRAEKDLLAALKLEPNAPFVLNYLGYSWIDKGINLDKAIAMIEKAVKLRPRDGYIIDSLGWGYYKLMRYPEAVQELEKAIELVPADPVINDHLGDAYWRVGRTIEARFQWNRALLMKPEKDNEKSIRLKIRNGLKDPAPAPSAVKSSAAPDNG